MNKRHHRLLLSLANYWQLENKLILYLEAHDLWNLAGEFRSDWGQLPEMPWGLPGLVPAPPFLGVRAVSLPPTPTPPTPPAPPPPPPPFIFLEMGIFTGGVRDRPPRPRFRLCILGSLQSMWKFINS